jgi:hypothetical protein
MLGVYGGAGVRLGGLEVDFAFGWGGGPAYRKETNGPLCSVAEDRTRMEGGRRILTASGGCAGSYDVDSWFLSLSVTYRLPGVAQVDRPTEWVETDTSETAPEAESVTAPVTATETATESETATEPETVTESETVPESETATTATEPETPSEHAPESDTAPSP